MSNEEETVSALVVFSVPLLRTLATARLPPTYVGVRRCRPSNKEVQAAWRKNNVDAPTQEQQSQVSFLIKDEEGNERRMTKKEKKETKRRIKAEQLEAKKKRKAECLIVAASNNTEILTSDNNPLDPNASDTNEASLSAINEHEQSTPKDDANNGNYHQLKVNSAAVEEELADLRGDRDGVPPVALIPCMALQAYKIGIATPEAVPPYKLDDELAHEWATLLKESFKEAEEVRNQEDLRTMAYQLVPEVWKRMRPDTMGKEDEPVHHEVAEISPIIDKTLWSWLPVRYRMDPLDSDKAIVCALLHSHSKNLQISCGSKFGCDLLVYDGPRGERHAFAGLRILTGEKTLPRSYDLHGYVRCLNTAGKLSLLAKVERTGNCARVAIVDLALEKILTAPRHAKRSVKQARRDVSKNLAKK